MLKLGLFSSLWNIYHSTKAYFWPTLYIALVFVIPDLVSFQRRRRFRSFARNISFHSNRKDLGARARADSHFDT